MADPSPFDPRAAFGDWLRQWEGIAREAKPASDMTVRTREAAGQWLAALNLPSREEVAAVAEAVRRVDERLARIEAVLGTGPETPLRRGRKAKDKG